MFKQFVSLILAVIMVGSLIIVPFAAERPLPKIDGSTSTIALDAAFSAAYTGADYEKTLAAIKHSKTFESLEKLIAGEVDIVLSVPISDEQQAAADAANFELLREAVALEGFVFVTNPDNPVKSLTEDELRGIYAGEITNWAEVGGDNAPIYAYQRNLDSGSQTYMNRFMGDTKMTEPPTEWYFTSMGHLMEAVSDYPTSKYSIGYSVYSYAVEELAKQKNFHLLSVNGIAPEKATFEDGSYPLLSYTYAYYDGATATKETLDFIDFMLSNNGQYAAADAGYIPVRNLGAKPYSAKGTGEPRPEKRIETREYSYCVWSGGELDGVLSNPETEAKINAWISEQKPLPEEQTIWFQAINGYLNICYGYIYSGEIAHPAENRVTACFNLKTGEQLTKFSDMFYKDSDFVPAANRALGMYLNKSDYLLTETSKEFNVAGLLFVAYPGSLYYYGGDDKEYWYNALGEAYKEMPAWEFYDMTHLFSDAYKNSVNTEKADLWTEQTFTYEKLLEAKIYYSRFLEQDEIERRNIELEKLYNIIEQSEEYKNYDYNSDRNAEFGEPIETEINFSEDGNIAYVWTPFGEYTLNRKTQKYKTPSNDFIMRNDTKFIGYIDYDLDGKPETVTLDKSINIYNEKWELVFSIPYVKEYYKDGYNRYADYIQVWKVAKMQNANYNGETYGEIICDEKIFTYVVNKGVPKLIEDKNASDGYLENKNTVYAAEAVDYPEYEYVSGKAKADFYALQNQIKSLEEKAAEADYETGYFALLTIQNDMRYIAGMSWAEDILYINGKANKSDAFPCYSVEVNLTEKYTNDYFENPYEVFLSLHYGGMASHLVPVFLGKDDSAIFPASEDGIGQGMVIKERRITLSHRIYDRTPDGSSLPGGTMGNVTHKDYWFYLSENGNLVEYGAIEISRDDFKTVKNSDMVLRQIANDGAKIENILWRSNDLVNINCTKKQDGYTVNVNYTYYVDDYYIYNDDRTSYSIAYQIDIDDEPIENNGVYLPSVLETVGLHNVVYPDALPE